MKSFLYAPSFVALALGILSGCGGGGSDGISYLPTGLQRTVDIDIQIDDETTSAYVFSFITISESYAYVYTGTSSSSSVASIHVVNYVPAQDTAEQIGFYWASNDDGTSTGRDALVVLYDVKGVSEGTGSATASVKDAEYTALSTQQDNLTATIRTFSLTSS